MIVTIEQNTMKKIIVASLAVLSMASMAEEIHGYIQDHYKNVARQIPSVQQVCRDVDVPVYDNYRGAPRGDAIILGGLVGNALGAATGLGGDVRTFGTIVGGIAGAEMSRGSGGGGRTGEFRRETHCSNVTSYTTQMEEVYSHSTITYTDDKGRSRTIQFRR